MKVTMEMLPGSLEIPVRNEVAPLMFSGAKGGGVKTLVPCRDGEVAWKSITSGWTRHEFTRDKECWRVAFVSKNAKNTPKAGEMWLCKYAGENPRKTVWFVEPVQRMWKCDERFWAGIVKNKDNEPVLWVTDDPRRMWWPKELRVHMDGSVGPWDKSALLPAGLTQHIITSFKVDLSGWETQRYEDSPVCAVSLTGVVLIGEKADKSYYKHYGLKNSTTIGLYERIIAEVQNCPALRLEGEKIVQGEGEVYVVREPDGDYWIKVEGRDAFERTDNFENLLKKLGIEYEVLSDVQVCHEFMTMILKAEFDPFGRE